MLNQPYQPMSSPNMSPAPWAPTQQMPQQPDPRMMQLLQFLQSQQPQNQQPQSLPWQQQQASPVGGMFMPQQNGQQQASPVGGMFMPQRSAVGSPSGIAQRPNGMIDQMRGMGPLMERLGSMYRQRQSERQLDPFSGFGQGPTGA